MDPDDADGRDGWLPNSGYYPDYLGCHVGVTDSFDMASGPRHSWYINRRGFDPDKRNNSAFSRALWMFIGTAAIGDSTQPDDRVDSFAIQEPLHTFISHEISVDNNLVDGTYDEHWHEHDLGKVWSSSDPHPTGSTSAMATLWADDGMDDHAYHGPCASSTSYDGSYDQSLTSCTIDAVRYTAAEATDGD